MKIAELFDAQRADAIPSAEASGARAIARSCQILKALAQFGPQGARLVDLTAATGLSRPTIHRMLQTLSAASFAEQNRETRRYHLGPVLFELGLAAPSPVDRLREIEPLLSALARRTGVTVYLLMRRGDEAVCLERVDGTDPIRSYVIDIGDRRTIAATVSGLAMMAYLDNRDADAILLRTRRALARYPRTNADNARRQIDFARKHQYAISEGLIVDGVTGLGVAVPTPNGAPYLGVSATLVSAHPDADRVRSVAAEMRRAVLQVSALLSPAAAAAPGKAGRSVPTRRTRRPSGRR
jgi:DNA-binding IclR family transcriptional regulator